MQICKCFLWWLVLGTIQATPQDSDLEAVPRVDAQSTDTFWSDELGTGTSSWEAFDHDAFVMDIPNGDTFDADSPDEDDSLDDISLDEDAPDEEKLDQETSNENVIEPDVVSGDSKNYDSFEAIANHEDTLNDGIDMDTFEQEDLETDIMDVTTTTKSWCEASCTLYAPRMSVVSWIPEEQIINLANVTVGIITTLVFLCNDITVATRLQTEYYWDSAPAGMYPPHLTTNDRGNAVAVVPFTDAAITSVVELVYPNSHIAYDTIVSWQGIVQDHNDLGDLVCVTATDEPSTIHLTSFDPISRNYYPEPTAARRNRSNVSLGQGFRPLWVPLDFQPPVSIIEQPIYIQHFPWGITECQKTAVLDPRTSVFYKPRYGFDYKTLSIDLDASGMVDGNSSAARWRNSTGSGALCVDFAQQFARLCERPEIPSSSDECVHTITIWNDTIPTSSSITYGDADRFGPSYRYTPQSVNGFETVDSTESTVAPFLYAEPDWIVDGKGGIVTTPGPQITPIYRNPDASEAAAIFAFLRSHTEELRVGSLKPQRTQPPTKSVEGLAPINSEAVTKYFKEPLGYPAQPPGNGEPSSDRPKGAGLNAVGSAFNRIFFKGTSTDRPHSEIPTVGADSIGSQKAATTVFSKDAPTLLAAQAVHAAADVPAGVTPTTARDYLYIQVSTTIDGVITAVGGYVLPITPTVMAGQQITVKSQAMQLPVLALLPAFLSTTINGFPISTINYIVSGRSIATIGQLITVNGIPTVLATPDAVFVRLSTTGIDGMSTTIPAYILNGSLTASIGQRVTLSGTPTVLAAPDMVPTYITITTSGVEELGLAYIVTGSMTATVGQIVTVEGSTTVLAEPTGHPSVVEGGAHRNRRICCNAVPLGIGVAFVLWV